MPEMHIRKAKPNDQQAVFELARELATSFTVEQGSFVASFTIILNDENSHLLVAEKRGRIVGYLLGFDHFAFYANGRIAWVEELYVLSSARKQGVGKALMTAFETLSTQRHSKLIALATRRAHKFYNAIGYQESAIYFKKTIV